MLVDLCCRSCLLNFHMLWQFIAIWQNSYQQVFCQTKNSQNRTQPQNLERRAWQRQNPFNLVWCSGLSSLRFVSSSSYSCWFSSLLVFSSHFFSFFSCFNSSANSYSHFTDSVQMIFAPSDPSFFFLLLLLASLPCCLSGGLSSSYRLFAGVTLLMNCLEEHRTKKN